MEKVVLKNEKNVFTWASIVSPSFTFRRFITSVVVTSSFLPKILFGNSGATPIILSSVLLPAIIYAVVLR